MGRTSSYFCGCFTRVKQRLAKWFSTDENDEDSNYVPAWKAMPFDETFRETLFSIPLEKHAKVVIMLRYVELVISVKHKHRNVFASYNVLRVTTLLSGLVTPVLFSITNDVPNRAALFWVTLVTSLLGSISNAWLEYFSIIKMHYTYLSASELLEAEGWHFCSLTGPYGGYDDHQSCWREFIQNTEKIHNSSVRQYMLNSQPQNRAPTGKELMKEAATTKIDDSTMDTSMEGSAFSNDESEKRRTNLRMRKRLSGIDLRNRIEEGDGEARVPGRDFSPSIASDNTLPGGTTTKGLRRCASSGSMLNMFRSVSDEGHVAVNIDNGKGKNE